MAKSRIAAPTSPETREQIFSVVLATAEPVTAGQVAKLLVAPHKLSEAKVSPILDEFVATSRLRSFPPKTAKGKPRYWDRDLAELARSIMLATLDKKGPQAKADLRKAVKQLPEDVFQSVFQNLIDSHALFEHPPLPKKKSSLLGSRPPAPEPYLREIGVQLAKVVDQLAAASVPRDELRRALVQLVESTGIPFGAASLVRESITPEKGAGVDLLSLMRSIEPAADNGALVAARDLRRAANMDKSGFDRAVLELARQGRVMLHRHDFAGGLSPAERDELVTDGAGTYYVGMAIRRTAPQG